MAGNEPRIVRLALAVAAMLVTAACSTPEASPSTTVPPSTTTQAPTTTTTEAPTTTTTNPADAALTEGWSAVEEYLDTMARGDYRAMRTVSQGYAHHYADYLVTVDRIDQFLLADETSTRVVSRPSVASPLADGSFMLNAEVEVATGTGANRKTFQLDEFVVAHQPSGGWLVETFRREGYRLSNLILAGTDETTFEQGGVTFAITYAFLSSLADQSGTFNLLILYTVDNQTGTPIRSLLSDAFISAESRRQYSSAARGGTLDVVPGSVADAYLAYASLDDAMQGGRLVGEIGSFETQIWWKIEVVLPPFAGD